MQQQHDLAIKTLLVDNKIAHSTCSVDNWRLDASVGVAQLMHVLRACGRGRGSTSARTWCSNWGWAARCLPGRGGPGSPPCPCRVPPATASSCPSPSVNSPSTPSWMSSSETPSPPSLSSGRADAPGQPSRYLLTLHGNVGGPQNLAYHCLWVGWGRQLGLASLRSCV